MLPESIGIVRVLGGLAPDTDLPMPTELQCKIQRIWRTIEAQVPGIRFNFDFWTNCHPRRATYAACRAVIAAARQAPESEIGMIHAIQQAYYCEAKNPSENSVLVELAGAMGLDRVNFARDLESMQTRMELSRQIGFAQHLGVRGFPSLVLKTADNGNRLLDLDYRDAKPMFLQIMAELNGPA